VNDYSGRYHHGYIASAETGDADLCNALKQLTDLPQLPAPEWPSWPK
jgi:hypothetical protein